jgi:hypothetical protein
LSQQADKDPHSYRGLKILPPVSQSQAYLATKIDDDGNRKGDKGSLGLELYNPTETIDAGTRATRNARMIPNT